MVGRAITRRRTTGVGVGVGVHTHTPNTFHARGARASRGPAWVARAAERSLHCCPESRVGSLLQFSPREARLNFLVIAGPFESVKVRVRSL